MFDRKAYMKKRYEEKKDQIKTYHKEYRARVQQKKNVANVVLRDRKKAPKVKPTKENPSVFWKDELSKGFKLQTPEKLNQYDHGKFFVGEISGGEFRTEYLYLVPNKSTLNKLVKKLSINPTKIEN